MGGAMKGAEERANSAHGPSRDGSGCRLSQLG